MDLITRPLSTYAVQVPIWVHPFVIGGGKRLFTEGGQTPKLQLTGTKTLGSGVVILTYTPAG